MTNIYRYINPNTYLDFKPGKFYTFTKAGDKSYLVRFQPEMGARFISSAFLEVNFERVG